VITLSFPGAPAPAPLTDRYEEVRAAVLGHRGACRWGLNVLLGRGMTAWVRALATAPDASMASAPARDRATRGVSTATPCPGFIPAVAQLVASRLLTGGEP